MGEKDFFGKDQLFITNSELDELAEFLVSDAVPEETMPLEALDGFFTALVVNPVMVPPSQWMPYIWDIQQRGVQPAFNSQQEAAHITELLIKAMSSIALFLAIKPEYYTPLPNLIDYCGDDEKDDGEYWDDVVAMWANGFMIGVSLVEEAWQPLFNHEHDLTLLLGPILALSIGDLEADPLSPELMDEFWEIVPECVVALHEYWKQYRLKEFDRLKGSKVIHPNRNDLCPCGSGKKFKKCCGK